MFKLTIEGDISVPLQPAADAAFVLEGLSGEAEVEVIALNEEEIKRLNADSRGIDAVTDVLSFPLHEQIAPFTAQNYPFDFDADAQAVTLGSIAVCLTRAAEQAEEYGHSLNREVTYLFVHGLLHLLGYDHLEEGGRRQMRAREEQIMRQIGVER